MLTMFLAAAALATTPTEVTAPVIPYEEILRTGDMCAIVSDGGLGCSIDGLWIGYIPQSVIVGLDPELVALRVKS
jgi:hypothetical protein